MHGNGKQADTRSAEFVDHKASHVTFVLSNHSDAVTLTQRIDECFLLPRKLKAAAFNLEHSS
jgi:hypothetical protein